MRAWLFILGILLVASRPSFADISNQISDVTFSYAGFSYSENSALRTEAGSRSGIQSGFVLKSTFSWSPLQNNTYWGMGFLVFADPSSRGSISAYALNADF